jgi:RNA polymerase sigma-54 factor
MVSVLALNKLELKEMINSELVENPVLEEIEESSESFAEISAREGDSERSAEDLARTAETLTLSADDRAEERAEADPFDQIDFGSYFQDFLDPGYRTASNFEDSEKPGFEHFLSSATTLTDHLIWQLGSMSLSPQLRLAAETIVGNLNEDGYLTASDEELLHSLREEFELRGSPDDSLIKLIVSAREVVSQLDPHGIGARDLRECLLYQVAAQRREAQRREARQVETVQAEVEREDGVEAELQSDEGQPVVTAVDSQSILETATVIVDKHLALLQKKDMRELVRLCRRPAEQVNAAVDLIRRLDPRPGQRYNQSTTRLIEPDVAFVKRGEDYVVVMNEDDLPSLRLSHGYRKMLREKGVDKDVREYVKERYKSAIQLLRNIDQRKNTILRTCESIVRRQPDFLERGVEGLRPMMIKEVAEEIGVHASTVSRAVANKYVHTAQGVFELRFFFSEGVGGPEGGDLPLLLLKRKVKKLIEEEDPRKPLTDDHLAAELQRQGIQVTRRTVAKYREDMNIPSTHQRRQR